MADEAKRRRTAAKGWATQSSKALATLLAEPTMTRLQLEDAIADFDRRLAALDDAQSIVELDIDDPDKLDEDIDAADAFRRQIRCTRVQATQKLEDMMHKAEQTGESTASASGSGDSVLNNIRLPRIELPKFSGDVLEWQSFWEQFEALVGVTNIPDVSKYGYLQSSLVGEAKRVIQGLTLTAANYHTACSVLKERFGKPERIIFAHIQALLNINLNTSTSRYIASLWKLQDQLNTHVRILEALGVEGDRYGVVLTPYPGGQMTKFW
ncbi:uncharacterized protein LOC123498431 [Portunus trituberculatus]|uniref:uncharacterized protein LOC123498431 n=1 Tax=Portunus trituberculatus TaxID=210409 RepID=UPI001E1CC513|nr:uncharacterized protein LOC123498431 [Portunus trituberculatus]